MSEPTDVSELPDDARAFLDQHQSTGEPSDAELARVRGRVLSAAPSAFLAERRQRAARRFPLSQEWLAVAAVVLALLGARAVYVVLHPAATESGPEVQAVVDAWRAGDLEGAQRLASQHCNEAACASLSTSLAKAVALSKRLDALSMNELDELARLDAELAAGQASPLALEIAKRRGTPPVAAPSTAAPGTPEQLLTEAKDLVKAKNLEGAIARLERCTRVAPDFHPCYRLLGSTWARIAARDADARAMDQARLAYERFLQVAPPDDEYVPKVKMILDQARRLDAREPDQPPTGGGRVDAQEFLASPAAELFVSAERAKARGDWATAATLATRVLKVDPGHLGARALLAEARSYARDVYLRAYQLKESDPAEALRLFQLVVDLTPDDDEYHQKAKSRVAQMQGR